MANEIRATYDWNASQYALIFDEAGQVWDTTAGPAAFAVYNDDNQADYDIAMVEQGDDSGEYRGDWPPTMDAGIYSVQIWVAANPGNPVQNDDERIGVTGIMHWDGMAEITLSTITGQLDVLGAGSGGTEETYTVTDSSSGNPIDGVHVWVTTDIGGSNIIWAGFTNASGIVKYYHDLATGTTVYLWRELAGYTFTNPDSETTS